MGRRIEIDKVYALLDAYKSGRLGGEKMPEDENPPLDKSSKENYLYFTLPMALNYQRNSYSLWECANKTYKDSETTDVFDTKAVINMNEQQLREKLIKYKVALQPNKLPVIWRTICETIENDFAGDIRRLFRDNDFSVQKMKEYIATWILGNMTMNSHHRSLKALDFTDILPFILDLCLVMFYNDYINMTR